MLYDGYELQRSLLDSASAFANLSAEWLQSPGNPFSYSGFAPILASGLEVFAHASASRGKPAFGLDETIVDGQQVPVHEEIVLRKPFGQLKHFVREGVSGGPKLLVVAPMSGHFATLLRGTIERMLPRHDVYVTDWRDAKLVPMEDGVFDLDSYIDYVMEFMRHIGPGTHVLAVCQPSVPSYAAACLMAEDGDPCRPASLTMMGGPIDTRAAPTRVNTVAMERPLSWFENNVVLTVPGHYPGAGRRVYPGFLQLAGFMAMNLGNHMVSHWQMFKHLVAGDEESAESTKAFYEEYRSVCDMPAEFYLQTVDAVFQSHLLPRGLMQYRNERRIDPAALRDVALLAIEGENDDISGVGQTQAALTIATQLPDDHKRYFMAPSVGHYGIFNGRRWREEIAPVVEEWILAHDPR